MSLLPLNVKVPFMMRMLVVVLAMMAGTVMAEGISGAGVGVETNGGVQAKSGAKFTSNLLKGNVTYATEGLTGIGTVPDKVTTGSVYGGGTQKMTTEQLQGLRNTLLKNQNLTGTNTKTLNTHGLSDPAFNPDFSSGVDDGFQAPTGHTGDVTSSFNPTNDKQPTDFVVNKDGTISRNPYETDNSKDTAEQKDVQEETRKLSDSCKDSATQAESGKIAGSDDAIRSEIQGNGGNPTDECVASTKKSLQACAKGDVEAVRKEWKKGETLCAPVEQEVQVNTKTPISSAAGAVDAGAVLEGPVNTFDEIKNKLSSMFQLNANGQANPVQQMLMGMLMQKVQEMMGGGSGGGSDDGGYGDGYPDDDGSIDDPDEFTEEELAALEKLLKEAKTCNEVTKTANKTVTTYEDAKGKTVSAKDKTKEELAKLTKVVADITTKSCQNGNVNIISKVTTTDPKGKVTTSEEDDLVLSDVNKALLGIDDTTDKE